MSAAPKKDPPPSRPRFSRNPSRILKRTGAITPTITSCFPPVSTPREYIEKTLVTTEPSFTEGLGAVIAKHFRSVVRWTSCFQQDQER